MAQQNVFLGLGPAQVLHHLRRVLPDQQREVFLRPGHQPDLRRINLHKGMLPCNLGLRRRSFRNAILKARISSHRVRP
ncbi:MAG: hypothetical protein ACHQC8_07805, partial [Solirubrobacterales bacterium]